MLDAWDCYELCVQSPRHVSAFLRGVHANEPTVLREDFCGTAALATRWCEDGAARGEHARALGVDLDEAALQRGRARAATSGVAHAVHLVRGDCLPGCALAPPDDGADVIFVGNFSIGYIHDRRLLLDYLKVCRSRLQRGQGGFGGGVFVCDLYGGASAFTLGGFERRHPSRGREVIRYAWAHEAADPATGMVRNAISFRVELDGEVVQELPRAFVYEWRLWSLPELRDACAEAGFISTHLYKDVNVAPGQAPIEVASPDELGADWIVLLAARTA